MAEDEKRLIKGPAEISNFTLTIGIRSQALLTVPYPEFKVQVRKALDAAAAGLFAAVMDERKKRLAVQGKEDGIAHA